MTEQLDAGVRYLDLRVAHMLGGPARNLHFVHMVYTTALVEDTLTEISEWLESHPREVVILACRNFDGMTAELHQYLVTCIKNIFGDMLCPRGVRLHAPHTRRSSGSRRASLTGPLCSRRRQSSC